MYNNVSKIKKSGISLIALIITIVVSIILLSVTVVQVQNQLNKTALVNFATNINKIQDEVKKYYIVHSELPAYSNEVALNEGQAISLVDVNMKDAFIADLSNNGDFNNDNGKGQFYEIDLSKLNISETIGGLKSSPNDVYVVAYPSMVVYYLKGVTIGGEYYFSLTPDLGGTLNIQTEDDNITPTEPSKISLEKQIRTWTNSLPIDLKYDLKTEDSIYLKFANVTTEKQINVSSNNMVIKFNLSGLFKDNKDLSGNNILKTALTQSEVNTFSNLPQAEKNIKLIRKSSGVEVESVSIDLLNFDDVAPSIEVSSIDKEQSLINILNINVNDNLSGVKEIKYDYLSKLNDDGSSQNYYNNITNFEASYLIDNGKSATLVSDNTYKIELPKNINKITMLVLDNAGNWSKTDVFTIT